MLRVVLAVVAILAAAPAWAGDKLLRGPEPDWVRTVEIKPPPLDADGAAIRILLTDHQLRIDDDGQSEYVRSVIQVRTALGLAAAGSMSLVWSPDIDTLTVHRLAIRRGDQVIDVLEKQDFEIIRRETNLERAMLDGLLSATLQPEGLQAGDIVELAYTRARRDPVLQGKAEYTFVGAFGRVDRMRLSASWATGRDLAWTAGSGLDKPKVTRSGGRTELLVDMRDVEPLEFPTGAPPRFMPLRRLSISEFKAWDQVSILMEPHFAKAAQLAPDSPLHAEVARIRAASDDPKVRAGLALQLVEDQIRYLALTMSFGGYIPATADDTWRRRFGDCKAKTALLMALLRELGIEAEAALVEAAGGHFVAQSPPGLSAFNHVIVRAVIDGQVYWMDGTRNGDRKIETLGVPAFGHALPLRTAGSDLIPLVPPPLARPNSGMVIKVDASAGLDAPAPVTGEITLGGDMGHYMALFSSSMPQADREKALKQMWAAQRWIEPDTVALESDAQTGQAKVVMTGTAKLLWLPKNSGPRWLMPLTAQLSGRSEYKRDPGPNADAPWMIYGHPSWTRSRFEVVLPDGGEGFTIEGDDIDLKAAGRAYLRRSRIEKGVAIFETELRTLASETPHAEAVASGDAVAKMNKTRALVRAPSFYRGTKADILALADETPKTVEDYVGRGARYMGAGREDLALADFEKAIETDPKSPWGWANRGAARLGAGKRDLAAADFAKTLELDPRNFVAIQGQGSLAMMKGDYPAAIAAYSRASDLSPKNPFPLAQRATAYWMSREFDKALADLADIEELEPGQVATYELRYQIYNARNQRDLALAEIDRAIEKAPDDVRLHVFRGGLLSLLGRAEEAAKAFDRAIAIRPTPQAYVTRAHHRDPSDTAGRLADLDAAAKLEPETFDYAGLRAAALADAGRFDEAVAVLDAALREDATRDLVAIARADILLRAGRGAAARREIARLRKAVAGDAQALNGLCWLGGTRNHELEAALADCDAALALEPRSGATLDSRGLVLLRLDRLPEALAAYDRALELMPGNAESFYGRGLVRLRLGQSEAAEADFAAARAASNRIDRTFTDFGIPAPIPRDPPKVADAATS